MIWNCLKTIFFRSLARKSQVELIRSEEICRRFLFDSKHFKRNRVTHQAFALNKRTGNVSLFLKNRFLSDEDYELIRAKVAERRGRSCKAEGEFFVSDIDKVRVEAASFVRESEFVLELDEVDFSHHVNLDRWPADKAVHKQLQQALAAKTKLISI